MPTSGLLDLAFAIGKSSLHFLHITLLNHLDRRDYFKKQLARQQLSSEISAQAFRQGSFFIG